MTYLEWKENYRLERIKRNEIWKDIPEYEGIYQVSSLGNIRSLDRVIKTSNQGGECYKSYKGRNIKTSLGNKGYFIVTLNNFGRKTFSVHQLVAITFLNHIPCGLETVVDHKDYNILNNRLDNLQLITNRENCSKDKFRKDYSSEYTGVHWNKQKQKWRAQIQINNNNIHLGLFDTELEAHKAYQKSLLNSI